MKWPVGYTYSLRLMNSETHYVDHVSTFNVIIYVLRKKVKMIGRFNLQYVVDAVSIISRKKKRRRCK